MKTNKAGVLLHRNGLRTGLESLSKTRGSGRDHMARDIFLLFVTVQTPLPFRTSGLITLLPSLTDTFDLWRLIWFWSGHYSTENLLFSCFWYLTTREAVLNPEARLEMIKWWSGKELQLKIVNSKTRLIKITTRCILTED